MISFATGRPAEAAACGIAGSGATISGMWPDEPHLDNVYEVWPDSPGVNAVGRFVLGLMHEESHLGQIADVVRQARLSRP